MIAGGANLGSPLTSSIMLSFAASLLISEEADICDAAADYFSLEVTDICPRRTCYSLLPVIGTDFCVYMQLNIPLLLELFLLPRELPIFVSISSRGCGSLSLGM